MKSEDTNSMLAAILLLLLSVTSFAAAAIAAYQTYIYFRSGEWPSFPLLDALSWIGLEWAHEPADWLGLYKFLTGISLTQALVVCGSIPIFIWVLFNLD